MAIMESAREGVKHEERDLLWESVLQSFIGHHGTKPPEIGFCFDADFLQVSDRSWTEILESIEIRFHDLDSRSQHPDISQLSLSLSDCFGT